MSIPLYWVFLGSQFGASIDGGNRSGATMWGQIKNGFCYSYIIAEIGQYVMNWGINSFILYQIWSVSYIPTWFLYIRTELKECKFFTSRIWFFPFFLGLYQRPFILVFLLRIRHLLLICIYPWSTWSQAFRSLLFK